MPGVTVRLISPNEPYQDVSSQIGEAGEVQVLGSNIFQGYWEDPETTAKEFVVDEASGERWFRVSLATDFSSSSLSMTAEGFDAWIDADSEDQLLC
jgi:acyl-CoA synthetase (AMP-forming)/AMP-acid ligase II